MRILTAALAGLVFALGLGISGMTDPARILAFLDFAGPWDPSLAFVMVGGIGSYATARRLILRRRAPVLADSFPAAPPARIDARLLGGASLFGIGWGVAGWCPGPALVSIGAGAAELLVFVGAMVAGMSLFRFWEPRAPTVPVGRHG